MLLKALRLSKKLTQYDICKAINCPQSVYSRYEREERYPSTEIVVKLAQFYDVSIEYLLELPEPDNPHFSAVIRRLIAAGLEADNVAIEDAINFLQRHRMNMVTKRFYGNYDITKEPEESIKKKTS